ncbi:hypothetical protein TNCV_1553911 [Trichonephila clavipes]|nr:hypothetical protein TNCV_1553911 [Trichonephila clavipes]
MIWVPQATNDPICVTSPINMLRLVALCNDRFNVHRPPLHGGSPMALGLDPTTRQPCVCDPYADDIDVIVRTLPSLKEAFLALKIAASQMGLVINGKKD